MTVRKVIGYPAVADRHGPGPRAAHPLASGTAYWGFGIGLFLEGVAPGVAHGATEEEASPVRVLAGGAVDVSMPALHRPVRGR